VDKIRLVSTSHKAFHGNLLSIWEQVKKIPDGKSIEIIVRPFKQRRSNPQNGRLWAIHTQAAMFISANTGSKWTSDDMHEWFKDMYCGVEEASLPNGQKMFRVKSSTELNTEEMSIAQEKYVAYLQTDLGIPLDI
jgi:hypothetical protein